MNDKSLNREKYWKSVFSEAAQKYESDDQISLWTEHGLYRRIELCFRILDKHLNGSERILDVGCGPGPYCRILAERGYSVVGLDYSESVLRQGSRSERPLWFNRRRYNPFKLRHLLQQHGFRNIQFQGVYIFPKYARFLERLFDRLDTKFGIRFLIAAQAFVIVASIGEERR